MINLPRKLVYTDKTNLSDFTEENELNRDIRDVLEGYLQFRRGYFSPVVPAMQEKEILDIFNNAYYFAVLAANDAGALDFFRNCDKYGSAMIGFQVTLVILALQKNKNDLVRKVLKNFMHKLNPLLNGVLLKFESAGQLMSMDLSPCPPAIGQLEVDWEDVTASFNRDKVLKILSLWKTKDEKKKVLHQIWVAALVLQEESTHSEKCMYIKMLQGALEDGDGTLVDATTYYATVIGGLNKENAALKEEKAALEVQTEQAVDCDAHWVRQVVDYAKNRYDWPEAKPFSDMLNYLLRGKGNQALFDMVDEIELHFHQEKKRSDVNIDQAGNVFVNPQNVNNHG